MLYQLAHTVQRWKWLVISSWCLMLLVCLPFLSGLTSAFQVGGFIDPRVPSVQAEQLLSKELGYGDKRFIVTYQKQDGSELDMMSRFAITDSLDGLKKFSLPHAVIYPSLSPDQFSDDNKTAYAVILMPGGVETDDSLIASFKASLPQPPGLVMKIGGEPLFLTDAKHFAQADLRHAEMIAFPVILVVMFIIFRSVFAAAIPILLGAVSISIILTILLVINHFFSLSIFAVNMASMLGLGLTLDYVLFLVSRFREELTQKQTLVDAVAITTATAGKSVLFSGLTLLVSIATLLLFRINLLYSIGIAGIVVVIVAVAMALTLLPAVLNIVGMRINRWSIPRTSSNFWQKLTIVVMRYPLRFFLLTLILLLALGYPFTKVKLETASPSILPVAAESRQVYDLLRQEFNENALSPLLVVIQSTQNDILSQASIERLYNFTQQLLNDKRIVKLYSVVNVDPRLSLPDYYHMYSAPENITDERLKFYLQLTTRPNLTVISLMSRFPINSLENQQLVQDLRDMKVGEGWRVQVAGAPALYKDTIDEIVRTYPYVIALTVVLNYLLLLVLFRSVVIPLKSILMNFLSLLASFGMLVFIFQEGHFSHLLNFEPLGFVELTLPLIIFCSVFGISMDYEIFMLTRIKEHYEKTQDNLGSVASGMQHCASVITAAAIALAVVCLCFASADVVLIKALGLGTAIAVIIDATIIRALLVPATMRLLGEWNWYLPKWLDRILPRMDESMHCIRPSTASSSGKLRSSADPRIR